MKIKGIGSISKEKAMEILNFIINSKISQVKLRSF